MKFSLLAALALLLAVKATAQVPDTEIYLLDMKYKDGSFSFGTPVNISNNTGYDNQPAFAPDGTYLLFTSLRDSQQADVYQYVFKTKILRQVTETEEDEYSPTFIPGKKSFSTVRVEADSTQRLWQFALDGSEPRLLIPEIDSIGYHCWIDGNELAIIIITEPLSLHICKTGEKQTRLIAPKAGRSLVPSATGRKGFYYVDKADSANGGWMIRFRDAEGKTENVVRTLGASEDLCQMKDGTLLAGSKGKLFAFNAARDKEWKQVADFSNTEIKDFYRLAVSPAGDKIALVSFKGEKP